MAIKEILKITILFSFCLYIAPFLYTSIKKYYLILQEPRTHIGIIYFQPPFEHSLIYRNQLYALFSDMRITGIIIIINSGDLPAGTSQALFYDVLDLKKKYPKPIIAFIENECLSTTYLFASASDYIVATDTALIGGIGIHQSDEKLTSDLSNNFYEYIVKHIASSRKLSLATIQNWANKKIFTGKQALQLGLINNIGSISTICTLLKERGFADHVIQWEYANNSSPASVHLNITF